MFGFEEPCNSWGWRGLWTGKKPILWAEWRLGGGRAKRRNGVGWWYETPLQFCPCRFPTSILSSVPTLSFFPYFKTELIEVTVERGGSVDTGLGFRRTWILGRILKDTTRSGLFSRMSVQMPKKLAKHLCAALCTLQFLGLSADLAQLQQRPPASNTTSKCS